MSNEKENTDLVEQVQSQCVEFYDPNGEYVLPPEGDMARYTAGGGG